MSFLLKFKIWLNNLSHQVSSLRRPNNVTLLNLTETVYWVPPFQFSSRPSRFPVDNRSRLSQKGCLCFVHTFCLKRSPDTPLRSVFTIQFNLLSPLSLPFIGLLFASVRFPFPPSLLLIEHKSNKQVSLTGTLVQFTNGQVLFWSRSDSYEINLVIPIFAVDLTIIAAFWFFFYSHHMRDSKPSLNQCGTGTVWWNLDYCNYLSF